MEEPATGINLSGCFETWGVPTSRLYLRLFKNRAEMERDELHKTLRGTGISQGDLEARGWIRVVGRTVHIVPIRPIVWPPEPRPNWSGTGGPGRIAKKNQASVHFLKSWIWNKEVYDEN